MSTDAGTVVLSIDAELAWGFHDMSPPPERRVESGRSGWRTLCSLLETYEVPATWALVGHLFHDACDGEHPSHPAGRDWFAREREEWAERSELACGPDLIERVRASDVDHDLGCHTYSHVEFGAHETSREVADYELARATEIARRHGLDLSSFVFPRNNVGHLAALADHGFDAYRGPRPVPKTNVFEKLRTVAVGDDHPPLVEPRVDQHGLVDVPASLFLFSFEGAALRAAKPFVGDPIVELCRRGFDAAARDGGVFHVWLHPNNLVGNAQVERMERILSALDRRRDELRIETMADVARRVRREESEPRAAGAEP